MAVVIKFKTEEEVIAMANDSVYGLGGAVWTRDINRAIRVARGVETGRMWVNTYNQIPSALPSAATSSPASAVRPTRSSWSTTPSRRIS